MSEPIIGVGVIGMGFMGWRHVDAYVAAAAAGYPCEVRAMCDATPENLNRAAVAGNIPKQGAAFAIDQSRTSRYHHADQLIRDPNVQLVSVCTPTDSHVELALAALRAGKHVIVEKPVALTAEQVRPLAEAARLSTKLCMPAHCIRFWPGWGWLRDRIVDGEFGAVRSASFLRAGAAPTWSRDFYGDFARSGGALADFHIHDADFILWTLGRPARVRCEGSLAHPRCAYDFGASGPVAYAEAEWSTAPNAPFRMQFTVEFERATAEFRLGRDPLVTLTDSRGTHPVPIATGTGYDAEVRHIVSMISTNRRDLLVTMDDALAVAQLIDAERHSLQSGDWVDL